MRTLLILIMVSTASLFADIHPDAEEYARENAVVVVEGVLEVKKKVTKKEGLIGSVHITATIHVDKTVKGKKYKKIPLQWTYYTGVCNTQVDPGSYEKIRAKWYLHPTKSNNYTVINLYCVERLAQEKPKK